MAKTSSRGIQALVDHGYAVAMVNYRGSTGYGRAFRESIVGNYGLPECADIVRALDSLVADGIADPARVAIEGWSWGGYLSLLAPGLYPADSPPRSGASPWATRSPATRTRIRRSKPGTSPCSGAHPRTSPMSTRSGPRSPTSTDGRSPS